VTERDYVVRFRGLDGIDPSRNRGRMLGRGLECRRSRRWRMRKILVVR
jgi:hypothetical protein